MAASKRLFTLQQAIERMAAGVRAEWGIYVKLLGSGEEVALDADRPMDTMSVIKLPVLVELLRQAEAGDLDLERRIRLAPEHRRFGTGVLSLLDDGVELSLRDAARLMIVQSDNAATDICFDAIGGPHAVTSTMRSLGFASIEVLGTTFDWFSALAASMDSALGALGPGDLFAAGYPELDPQAMLEARHAYHFGGGRPLGRASAADIGRLIERLVAGEVVSASVSEQALAVMRAQQHRTRIPRYLPGVGCAHKTGDFEPFIANDVGVIDGVGVAPVVCVFLNARHFGLWENLEEAVARMAEQTWRHAVGI
jgi:beta-lactamase class A